MVPDNEIVLVIKYFFQLKNLDKKEFKLELDKTTLNLHFPEKEVLPKWVDLNFFKCTNCPLDEKTNPNCPAAVSMIDVIEFFSKFVSFEEAYIEVETENRSYSKHTTLQTGISSLIGLSMATSGCPVLGKLKPMARFHLPFSGAKETVFRAISTYLLGQYFRKLNGQTPDWDLENLDKIYAEIHKVNKSFAERLKHIKIHDASINAINILDTFANFVQFEIHNHVLKELECIMSEYLED